MDVKKLSYRRFLYTFAFFFTSILDFNACKYIIFVHKRLYCTLIIILMLINVNINVFYSLLFF